MHSRECRGCAVMLQEPTIKSKKRIKGNGIQPEAQRVLRVRNPQARYNFSEDEEGAEEEIQGYLCVSADPRRSGQTAGGENFIITTEELRSPSEPLNWPRVFQRRSCLLITQTSRRRSTCNLKTWEAVVS
jgi:hypothetical protein